MRHQALRGGLGSAACNVVVGSGTGCGTVHDGAGMGPIEEGEMAFVKDILKP